MNENVSVIRTVFRQSRPVAFRDRLIRLVDINGETWVCASDAADAIDQPLCIPDRAWNLCKCIMANIDGKNGITSHLCLTFDMVQSLAACSQASNDDARALWDWIDQQSPKWETMAYRELQRRKMALFNEFHRVRRFANSIEFDEARKHALSWIELLGEIDVCTTLEERFELCGTNTAHRKEMIECAKEQGSRLTMHAILSVWKGGNTATYRPRDGCRWYGETFGMHLSWFTTIDRKDLNPLAQFFDLGQGFPARKQPAPGALAAQFADLTEKRSSLVKLSRDNRQRALETGMANLGTMYGHVGALHEHVLSIFREATTDGSIEAIESALSKAEPFCVEATAMESNIVKILKSDTEDASPRVLH